MNKITIDYKIETTLIKELFKQNLVQNLEKQPFVKKLFLQKKSYANIYFHSGKVDNKTLDIFNNSKKIVVNSNKIKENMVKKHQIEDEKIEVIYPTFKPKNIDETIEKEKFLNTYGLKQDSKIILFSSNEPKKDGVIEFIKRVVDLSNESFVAVVLLSKKEQESLNFILPKDKLDKKIIFCEEIENIDTFFAICDIFLLPTYKNSFSLDILKAMFYKSAVFVPISNHSSEIIDVFATLNTPSCPSTSFKIDAILNNIKELENIKKSNYTIAKEYILEKAMEKIGSILKAI